ncbi:hypothetical protein [Halothermothrix orenii]|uniref:Uncharacterized protein n=1 Tax=Halothermothrix orenii (strain H 168 / OCM 544 / DSM 9562) TaxID=373903 RepID=B8CZ82_HALOH|nr:hypothetical protein [Halothermothrix orenii]ACL70601.1 hypothetical protein Hore_18520 [Halothermothrix orenii H 168]
MNKMRGRYIFIYVFIIVILLLFNLQIVSEDDHLSKNEIQFIKSTIYKEKLLPLLNKGVSFKVINWGKEVSVHISNPENKEYDYYVYIDYCYRDWDKNVVTKDGKKKKIVYCLNKEGSRFIYKDIEIFYGEAEDFKKEYFPVIYSGIWKFPEKHVFDPVEGNKKIMLEGIVKTIGYDLRYQYQRNKDKYSLPSEVKIAIGEFNAHPNFTNTVVKIIDEKWPRDIQYFYNVSLDFISIDKLKEELEKHDHKYKMYYAYRYIGGKLRPEVEQFLNKYSIKVKIPLDE